MNSLEEDYQKISDLHNQLIDLKIRFWIQYDVFTLHWWILLAASILPWIVWWKLADRNKFNFLIPCGLLWMIISTILDDIGIAMGLWEYPQELFSFIPPLFPADMTILPVTFMLIYQYFPRGRSLFVMTSITAISFAFIIEPIFMLFNLYRPSSNWKHIYTMIVLIILSYFIKWSAHKLQQQVPKPAP